MSNLEDSLFTVTFAADDGWHPAPRSKSGRLRKKKTNGKGYDYKDAADQDKGQSSRGPTPIEQGANLEDALDRLKLADLAEERGDGVRVLGQTADEHRFMADWYANETQILEGHPAVRPGMSAPEARAAVEKAMVDAANLPDDDPRHHEPYLNGAWSHGPRPGPDRLNAVAEAVEKLAWVRDVEFNKDPGQRGRHLRDDVSMLAVYREARKSLPNLSVMEFHKAIGVLERNRQLWPQDSIYRKAPELRSAQEWALAMPFSRNLANDLSLSENGDGFTYRGRFRPDGSLMNWGHADVIARAYARRGDPAFSDDQYRELGQGQDQHGSRSWRWLSEDVSGLSGGSGPKTDELVRLAGLMGIPAALPERRPDDSDRSFNVRSRAYGDRLRLTIRQTYLAGRGGERPTGEWLDYDLRPRGVEGTYQGGRDYSNAEIHQRRQSEFADLPDDAGSVYKLLVAADDGRRDPSLALGGDEVGHARERIWSNVVRALGGDASRPMSPAAMNALVLAAGAWSRSEDAYPESAPLRQIGLLPAALTGHQSDGESAPRRYDEAAGRRAWQHLRAWFDSRWRAGESRRWYSTWR